MSELVTQPKDAPDLFPAYVDLWAQTRPAPPLAPDPSPFLHGLDTSPPDVNVVWRADLVDRDGEESIDGWMETITALPPTPPESVAVPFRIARQWLTGTSDGLVADIEGTETSGNKGAVEGPEANRVAVWRGREASFVTDKLDEIRPGDTIVIPTTRGGLDKWGWSGRPEDGPVADRAEAAAEDYGVKRGLRLHPAVIPEGTIDDAVYDQLLAENDPDLLQRLIRESVKKIAGAEVLQPAIRRLAHAISVAPTFSISAHPDGSGWVVQPPTIDGASTEENDEHATSAVGLREHLNDVSEQVRCVVEPLALDENAKRDLELAAELHDLGKADPRFQRILYGGNLVQSMREPPRAKSPAAPRSRRTDYAVRLRSGYPAGARHEVLSWGLTRDDQQIRQKAADWELVQHLVVSHHGWGRPLVPVVSDPAPRTVSIEWNGITLNAPSDASRDGVLPHDIDSGVVDLFWRCTRRYGWWGLAYLEAILRLSDHRASANPRFRITEDGEP